MRHLAARAAAFTIAALLVGSGGDAMGASAKSGTSTGGLQGALAALANLLTGGLVTAGQPNVECDTAEAPNTPGKSSTSPGSPFNEEGKAGTVYAGEQPQNSKNPKSVSQYDVACAHAR